MTPKTQKEQVQRRFREARHQLEILKHELGDDAVPRIRGMIEQLEANEWYLTGDISETPPVEPAAEGPTPEAGGGETP